MIDGASIAHVVAGAAIDVRPLPSADLTPAAQLLATAFHDDPFTAHLFPDEAVRAKALPLVFRGEVARSIGQGAAVGAYEGERLVGVGVLNPAGDPGTSLATHAVEGTSYLRAAAHNWRHLPRMVGTSIQTAARAPEADALHVNLLGVAEGQQGKGIGTKLLQHALGAADRLGVPARIETSNPRNVPLYERVGFHRIDEFDAWGDGPHNVTLWRDAPTP